MPCEDDQYISEEKSFCFYGCKAVYEILSENNLCEHYNIEEHPGRKTVSKNEESYQHLDEPEIRKQVLEFEAVDFARARLFVPAIHCSSCIWLLENLQKLDHGITRSEVNFPARTVMIEFLPGKVSLARIAGILTSLGYPPRITLQSGRQPILPRVDRTPLMKLALAGFCFGNVMLFSFPEYLGLSSTEQNLKELFSWLNIALSIPVLFFSASDYFRSAWKSFSQKQINIDVLIAAGLAALFLRSTFDIVTGTGPGYLDSFTGLVFFLLIGKWFQDKTYESLAFDRDYKSYFPLSVWVSSSMRCPCTYRA